MEMMRGANGDMRSVNTALETVSAAATAIASAENRLPQASVQKRRWGSFLSKYLCFRSQKHSKRIGHAVLVPEPPGAAEGPAAENQAQPPPHPPVVIPFVAPPSSPASFLQSEPPSAAQSPPGLLSFASMTANMYSPSGPHSIFTIGPYAHETQLVSPPVFSTFTTEPSTAPFTPPPESVHLTTPSSPEVPFARLLDPNQHQGSGTLTPESVGPTSRDTFHLNRQNSGLSLLANSFSRWRNVENGVNHRVSFEITAEEVVRCVEKRSAAGFHRENKEHADQKSRSLNVGSAKEFNFDNVDGRNLNKPGVGSDWWANEKVLGKEGGSGKNWSFFPVLQPGIS